MRTVLILIVSFAFLTATLPAAAQGKKEYSIKPTKSISWRQLTIESVTNLNIEAYAGTEILVKVDNYQDPPADAGAAPPAEKAR